MGKKADPARLPCFEVTLHFHDRGLAEGVVNATPLGDEAIWKVTMKQGAD